MFSMKTRKQFNEVVVRLPGVKFKWLLNRRPLTFRSIKIYKKNGLEKYVFEYLFR